MSNSGTGSHDLRFLKMDGIPHDAYLHKISLIKQSKVKDICYSLLIAFVVLFSPLSLSLSLSLHSRGGWGLLLLLLEVL